MSRWQIKSVLFYSHDRRMVSLDFKPSDVTIIVGESYSGKSAIIEAIDYTMGASKCHIPGVVRESCSWVGVHWFRDKSEILICRRVPPVGGAQSSDEVYFDQTSPLQVPKSADFLSKRTGSDGALRMFEQALLMGDVNGVTFTEREGARISIRNAMPYILISDDVIIDKVTLLRGMNEWKQAILDSIPYFLGAVDETTATNEIRLKKLRAKLAKEESRRDSATLQDQDSLAKAKELVVEAVEIGIRPKLNVESLSKEQLLEHLAKAAAWTPADSNINAGANQLTDLYSQERGILAEISAFRSRFSAASDAVESAQTFSGTVANQREKLDLAKLFRPEKEVDACPVCNSKWIEETPSLKDIDAALKQLDGELTVINRDRPKIDSYMRDLEAKIDEANGRLKEVRGRITAIVRDATDKAQTLDLDPRRMRVAGRISFYLDTAVDHPDKLSDDKLKELQAEIDNLMELVDPEAKAERLDALQQQVSTFATEILRDLPFDDNYRESHVMFDARKIVVKFVLGSLVMEMRAVGGDESYLSGRVSTVLALHRIFKTDDRPVPGVIIFDQLSRPFYNPEQSKGQIDTTTSDSKDLKDYFDALFKEVEQQKSLQIIVLEHAYFQDDPRYQKAVIEKWGPQKRLIPNDWPRMDSHGKIQ